MTISTARLSPILIDTSFTLALASSTDEHHGRAVQLALDLDRHRTPMVITRAVMLEIGNALAHRRERQTAVDVLAEMEIDPDLEVISLSERLYHEALRLFSARQDKDWTLVDCVSFVVMQERDISDALTADRHFQQAGFRALLLDEPA